MNGDSVDNKSHNFRKPTTIFTRDLKTNSLLLLSSIIFTCSGLPLPHLWRRLPGIYQGQPDSHQTQGRGWCFWTPEDVGPSIQQDQTSRVVLESGAYHGFSSCFISCQIGLHVCWDNTGKQNGRRLQRTRAGEEASWGLKMLQRRHAMSLHKMLQVGKCLSKYLSMANCPAVTWKRKG